MSKKLPVDQKRKTVGIALNQQELDATDTIAAAMDVSRSHIVRLALQNYLRDIEEVTAKLDRHSA